MTRLEFEQITWSFLERAGIAAADVGQIVLTIWEKHQAKLSAMEPMTWRKSLQAGKADIL